MNKFRLANLAAFNVRVENDEPHYDYIGHVVAIKEVLGEETQYKLASFDGSSNWYKESELKGACHYIVKNADVALGNSASVNTLDHPHLGREFVWTTEVLAKNELGFFLTKNTLYIPNEVTIPDNYAVITMQSPLLK
jgi:hypothetical protein